MIKRARIIVIVTASLALTTPALAERLILSLSNHRVLVTSSFTGEDLVLFGTIEPDMPRGPVRASYDVIVTVTGPQATVRTRRKDRIAGVWINAESRQFVNVPSYLAVLSNRALGDIATATNLQQQQIGLANFPLEQRSGTDLASLTSQDEFRQAFIRLEQDSGNYRENITGVTFLTPTVFRAAIPLPATTPNGNYSVDVKVFSGGQMITRGSSALEVVKSGVEQYIATAAHDYGFLYGILTALMALATGWFASIVFRRD